MVCYKNVFKIVAIFCLFLVLYIIKVEAIAIGPDKYFLVSDNSEQIQEILKVYADQNLQGPTTFYLSVQSMKKVGEEDDRIFAIPNKNELSDISNNIKLSVTQITIKPGETLDIPWTYTSNKLNSCGTNLAAIVLSNNISDSSTTGESAVQIEYDVIAQIHIEIKKLNNISCDNSSKLELIEFYLDQNTTIFDYTDKKFITKVSNNGNVIYREPSGTIEITGFGTKNTIQFNPEKLDIYPNSTRKFTNIWQDENYPKDNLLSQIFYEFSNLRIGKYQAELILINETGKPINGIVDFWIIPWKIIIIIVLFLTSVVLIIKKFKSRNSRKKNLLQ